VVLEETKVSFDSLTTHIIKEIIHVYRTGVHSENKFWKYLIGSVIIIITSFIGQLPWLLGITYVTNIKGSHYPSSTDEMMHFFDP
jgi:hypothetical protein